MIATLKFIVLDISTGKKKTLKVMSCLPNLEVRKRVII